MACILPFWPERCADVERVSPSECTSGLWCHCITTASQVVPYSVQGRRRSAGGAGRQGTRHRALRAESATRPEVRSQVSMQADPRSISQELARFVRVGPSR